MPVSARGLLSSCSTPALARATLLAAAAAVIVIFGSQGLQTAVANGDTRTLTFHHMHTGEDITVTFKREGRYDEAALKQLNWFMRDWRKDESIEMDPQLFDLLWEAYRSLDGTQPIQVVCGYRSPGTNEMLRHRSSGVAKGSLHTHGQAMDFYIPGVSLEELRNVGLRLQRGGVGFYPTSGSPFVHMDTGNVRHWPRMTHDQLVKVFPDGRTVHVGTDGQPLKNYALALADIEKRGGHVSNVQLASAGSTRDEDSEASATDNDGRVINRGGGNVIARMFGFGGNGDDQKSTQRGPALAARSARPAPMPTPVSTTTYTPPAQLAQTDLVASIPLPRPAQRPVVVAAATPLPKPAPLRVARVETRNDPRTDDAALRATYQIASADPSMAVTDGIGAQAMAYAPIETRTQVDQAQPMGSVAARVSSSPIAKADETTTITMSKDQLTTVIRTQRYHEPWLRAVMLTPSVQNNLTGVATSPFDVRRLRDAMRTPSSAVMMSFANDPNNGMTADSFTGNAVVFVATATFGSRTAALATARFSSN